MSKHLVSLVCLLNLGLAGWVNAQCTFTVSDNMPCASETVNFTVDDPDNSVDYSWDMDGDGNTDAEGTEVDYTFPMSHAEQIYAVILYENGDSCTSQEITVNATPDASIGVPPGIVVLDGNSLKACNGSSSFDLEIFNASTTYDDNASYTINWGDGSPAETYDNTTFSNVNTITHSYNGLGYFTIFISVEHQNGCVFTNNYTFYNGGNPSVGLVIPGNTVGLCAPATLDFPINNTEGNPPGTEYSILINGEEVAHFTQEDLPPVFTYTFEDGSCGNETTTGNYQNAFDIRIVASNPCNSSTATIEPIEISTPPDPMFDISPPEFSCEGAVYGFSNATTNINEVISGNPSACIDVLNPSWTISGTAGTDWNVVNGNLFSSNEIDIEFLTPGVYTIEMTIVSFACGPVTISQTITIYEPPEPGAGLGDIEVGGGGEGDCIPVRVPFLNTTTGEELSYEWTIAPDTGWVFLDSTDALSANPIVQFNESGSYAISMMVSNPCSAVAWDTVLVMPGPPEIELAALPDFCNEGTLTIDSATLSYNENGEPINTYTWNFPGGTPASSEDAFPPEVQYDSPGTYTVELITNNACGTTAVADTFVVQEPTTVSLPDNLEFCSADAPVQLNATPEGGTWAGVGVNANGTFDPTAANLGSNTLTYTYGVGVCFSEDQMDINIIQAPDVMAGPDQEVCANEPALNLNASPNNGTWTDSNGNSLQAPTFDPSAAGAGTFTFYYSVVNSENCTNIDSTHITVNALPEINVPDTSFCDLPGSVSLPTASPVGGSWTGPGVVDPSGTFDPAATGGPGTYNLTYAYTDANGCSVNEPVNVGVIDQDQVNAGPDMTLCPLDEAIDLSAQANPPGGTWTLNGQNFDGIVDPQTLDAGQYTLNYTAGSGVCLVEDNLQISVIDLEPVSLGPDVSACLNDSPVQLTGANPGGGTWNGPGITDSQNGTFNPNIAQVGTHTLTYTVTDAASGCDNQANMAFVVHPLPNPMFNLPPVTCTGESFTLENHSTGASTYSWDFGNGQTSAEVTPTITYTDTGQFQITLVAMSVEGCAASIPRNTSIVGPPEADFTPDLNSGCSSLDVNLTNQSNAYDPTFFWNFGNGQTSDQAQPAEPIFYQGGINDTSYVVTLQVQNLCGTDTYRDTVEVLAMPIVDFGYTVDTGCAPVSLEFANVSLGSPIDFYWDFGNGQTSTDSLPAPQSFDADTTVEMYTITLIASNTCGSDSLSQELVVEPDVVQAFFNVSNTQGCMPFTVDFANYSTPGTFISWDFGDGNVISAENPTHTFMAAGSYTVMQHASNSCASDSTTIEIEVLDAPMLSFEHSPNLCTGQEIQFTNTSPNVAGTTWDFGNGDTSTLTHPVYTFEETGTYEITLNGVAAANGCQSTASNTIVIGAPPNASFEAPNANACTPVTVNFENNSTSGQYYQWTFGDGNSSVEANPQHTYTDSGEYFVRLEVTDQDGCKSDTVYSAVFAYPIPEADFEIQKEQICGLPVNVNFENRSEGAEGFMWELDDELTTPLVNPVQSYDQSGEYLIQLTASNQYGCYDTMQQMMTLYETPIADFGLDSMSGCQPVLVQTTNFSNGNRFYWDFGDGTTSTESQPQHVYEEAGFYDISLTVSYDDVCFDTLEMNGAVEVLQVPNASFEWVQEFLNNKPTGTIQFINRSAFAEQFFWDFGDGETSTLQDPNHRYTQNGSWQVGLTAVTPRGCKDDTLAYLETGLITGLYVPNAFAPEQGLGETTLFLPKGIGLKEYQVQIFSPYGQLIWESTKLDEGQPAEGWDGTFNGNLLPQDVYVWKVKAIFENETLWVGMPDSKGIYRRMGSVTLIR